jgi:hypothetical protein
VPSHHSRAKLLNKTNMTVFTLILLISISLVAQTPKTKAATPDSGLSDKAMAFLRDVVQLDMSKYIFTLNDKYTEGQHLFYKLDSANSNPFEFTLGGDIVFNFYNGALGSCMISPPGLGGLIFLHPEVDQFNSTLGIVQRYQAWTNDSQVQEMANLLQKVGLEKNATEISGNLTLRILVTRYTHYDFYNTFNGADYTGLSIFRSSTNLDLTDSRVFEKIGDTNINISKEQAINIAENTVKNYSFNATLGNQTKISVSNLNVTGVYRATLQTAIRQNSTLYPYWDIQLTVNNIPTGTALQGIGVNIWANDGTVSSVYHWVDADIGPLLSSLFFFPMYSSLLMGMVFFIFCAVAIVIVLVFVLKKNQEPEKKL